MSVAMQWSLKWVERGLVPDPLVRQGIRHLLRQRLREIGQPDEVRAAELEQGLVDAMRLAPIAVMTDKANEQHYEVPAEFFSLVLGPHRKYSGCVWPQGVIDLGEAEAAALAETCERAGLSDGQDVLELGCGWGSLSLWMASHYPNSRITGVSNSASQRAHILSEASRRGLSNVEIITCDMNRFETAGRFDRVVSVEMFEHMRNWPALFERIEAWLRPQGRFFLHVFAHRSAPYFFEVHDESDWMSRHFFSGGMMPNDDLALRFQGGLQLERRWRWSGEHYERTANAWLQNMDQRRDTVMPILQRVYGAAEARRWWVRWRLFFMACAELFGYDGGQQWWVSHYLFRKQDAV